jgi:hypothetical protein
MLIHDPSKYSQKAISISTPREKQYLKKTRKTSYGILATVKFSVVKMAYDFFTASNLPKEVPFSYLPVFTMTLPF